MKVFNKLLAAFLMVVAMLIGVGVFAIYELSRVNDQAVEIRDNWLPSVQSSAAMAGSLGEFRNGELQHVQSTTDADMTKYEKQMDNALANYRKADSIYAKLITEPEERQLYSDIGKLLTDYLNEHAKIIALSRQNKNEEALQLVRGDASRLRHAIDDKLKRIVEINVDGSERSGKEAAQIYAAARLAVLIVLGVATVLGIALAYVIARGLTKQLGGEPGDAATLASEIANGNLLAQVHLHPRDRSSLMFSLAAMKDQLTNIMRGIKVSSDAIAVAADEIAQGNTNLSQRTEEQAASLEETAASMEELTATVRHNADNAKQAATLAANASAVATRGGETVGRVVDTMHGISESSSKVAEIIGVIDSIAFQTNILALNAAVEAARAGEQGRGFAVVAGEVRTLAQRSAAAAKEIKSLIDQSVARVDMGAKLVEEAGGTITEIVRSVKRVTDIVGEISSASGEQRTGIEQVNTAVGQMDEVTQQNAALVEEASAAAQSLAEQAKILRDAVAVFRVSDGHGAGAAGAAAVRSAGATPLSVVPTTSRREPLVSRTMTRTTALRAVPATSGESNADWQSF
ncbi:methyl-accepting chemotaxis protein [Pandoraea terrae]|nr:methyl-accepting chemotaxis protein [Pandoraea terrae]